MKPRFRLDNLVYELTGACNQCCRFCYNYWRDDSMTFEKPDPALARRTLRKLLSQVSVGTLSFSGGEPLLLDNVHDLVLRARFRACKVNVLTNGTLLTDAALASFLDLGVGAIQIPLLSADPSLHDDLTRLPGSWEKALDALRRSGKAGVGVAVLVITRQNARGLEQILAQVRDCGVKTVMLNRFNLGGNGMRHAAELVPDREMLREAFGAAEAFAAGNPAMRFVSGVCTPLCFLDTAPYPHIRFSRCSNGLDGRPITVSYTGEVRFCNHSPFVMGSIYERPLAEILSDPEMAARYAAIPQECASCMLLERCGGGCRAASEQVYGTFARPDPILASGLKS